MLYLLAALGAGLIQGAAWSDVVRSEEEMARAAIEFERQESGNVAILRDRLPTSPGSLDPDFVARVARSLGYGVGFLTASQVASPVILHPANFDLLVLPHGPAFPADAVEALRAFLRRGGDFLAWGGVPFDELGLLQEGRWIPLAQLPFEGVEEGIPLFDLSGDGVARWSLSPAPGERGELIPTEEGQGFRLSAAALTRWVSAVSPPVAGLPLEAEATFLEMRGGQEDLPVFFEWDEKDGSRWRKQVVVGREWRWVEVLHGELEYWPDNPSVGRGGPGDRFRPENASQAAFGLTCEVLARGRPYWIEVRRIVAGRDRYAGLRHLQVNSHWGATTPATFLAWPPEAITVCDPAHPLEEVAVTRTAEGQWALREPLLLPGPRRGFSASGQIGAQWWSSENRARWTPLLSCFDAFGQLRGTAAGLMENYRGEYPGSSWAYSAVTEPSLLPPAAPESFRALQQLMARLVRGIYLYESRPRQHCFHEGEAAAVATQVANFGRADFQGEVRVEVSTEDGNVVARQSQPVHVPAGGTVPLTFEWPPEGFDREFYQVEVKLLEEGNPIDVQRTGLAFWRPEVVARGPRVSYEGAVLSFQGRPQFALGTQGYWGNLNVTATDPLVIDQDFRRMADAGLKICRIFMSLGERDREDRWRLRDLYLLLAQRNGIVVFMEGFSWPTADPVKRAEDCDFAARAARRYAGVPGLLMDIANEPYLRLADEPEALQEAFSRWLAARYGTETAWREAWGAEAEGLTWGQVPLSTTAGPWASCRAADADEFCAQFLREWARMIREAIRSEDPDRLVSVGHLQGVGWEGVAYDPLVGSAEMDFTNRHYYGPVDGFLPQFREIDQRYRGAAPSVGEFGATEHPAFTRHGAYDTHAGRLRRFQTIPFGAFGSGGLFACSWHWRDPLETVFPCGLVFADGAEKALLSVYRNVGLLLGQIEPRYIPPLVDMVVPLRHRWGGGKAAATGACAHALQGLLSSRLDFGTVGEDDLSLLLDREAPRLLIYPCAYCPPDATVEALTEFVRQGGILYLSGDLSYAPDHRRTRTHRLETLCGVQFREEIFPPIAYEPRHASKEIPPGAEGWAELAAALAAAPSIASPAIRVAPLTATVLATAGGDPLAVVNRVGQGIVVTVLDPVELHDPTDPGLLRALGRLAGVSCHQVVPDRPEVQSMRVCGADGANAHVFLNTSEQSVSLSLPTPAGQVRLEMAAQSPGFVLERKGQLQALAAVSCEVDGRLQFSSNKQLGVIFSGEAVILLPLDEGDYRIQLVAPGLGRSPLLSLGGFRSRRWVEFSRRPVEGNGRLSLRLHPPEDRCIGVIVPAGASDSAASVAEGLW